MRLHTGVYVPLTVIDLAGLVQSSHPVSHVRLIIGLQEVAPGNGIYNYRNRNRFYEYLTLTILYNSSHVQIILQLFCATGPAFLSSKLTKAKLCLGFLPGCSFIHLEKFIHFIFLIKDLTHRFGTSQSSEGRCYYLCLGLARAHWHLETSQSPHTQSTSVLHVTQGYAYR